MNVAVATTTTPTRDEKTMTQRQKSFRGGKAISDFEPIEFDLEGRKFQCKPAVQGAVLLEFVAQADGDSGGAAAGAIYGFFESCMPADQYKAFMELLNDPDLIFDMEVIGEIAGWLVEQYTARPTQPSSSSAPGLSIAGPGSTETPSSVG